MMEKLFEIDWLKYLTWGILLIAVVFLVKVWINPPITIYWFEVAFLSLKRQFACIFVPLFLLLACVLIASPERIRGIRLWIPAVLLFANILACAAAMPGLTAANEHQDSTVFESRVYYVMTSYGTLGWRSGFTTPDVFLYECDQFGLLCQEIYSYTGPRVYVEVAESWTASLMTDYAAETISLIVNGESVYTYQPE